MADQQLDRLQLEKAIHEIVGGPLSREMNGFADSEVYLAGSWLIAIHSYVRRCQGDTHHSDRVGRDQRQLLVAIANRLELDVETLLEADPDTEVRLVYEALEDLDADRDPAPVGSR